MNYGYDEDGYCLDLLEEDEAERYSIQLYHHTATQIDISKKNLLEVGSGRGGGSSYIQRYLKTRTVTGLDISSDAVQLSNLSFDTPGLSFVQGDSENLPFEDNSFDTLILRDALHHFVGEADFDKVKNEMCRVLRNDGKIIFFDPNVNFLIKTLRKILSRIRNNFWITSRN